MENVTAAQIATAIIVILAICGAIKVIGSAIDVIRGWKKPRADSDEAVKSRLDSHDKFFAADKRRLDELDSELADQREGQKVLCKGVQALLDHELHNGNADDMADASKGINNWLLEK